MIINSLGRVNVPVPGTPVPLTTNPALTASKIFVQAVPGLTGKTYLGTTAMAKATSRAWPGSLRPTPPAASRKTSFWSRRTGRTASG